MNGDLTSSGGLLNSVSTVVQHSGGNQGTTTRGFTGHEHLDDVQLIHMNGRAYDYNLGRFLSVDPVIQSPRNSQSINPYSYIMNNPLAGKDPSGYTACKAEAKDCEQPKPKGDDKKKERRDPLKGRRFGWQTVWVNPDVLNNGANNSQSSKPKVSKTPEQIGSPSDRSNDQSNVNQVEVTGSQTTGRTVNTVKVEINLSASDRNQEGGYDSVNDAVIAQLRSYSDEYQKTVENGSELTGMVFDKDGKFYFTNMVEVPVQFRATVNLKGFGQKNIAGLVHTHPDNYTFTGVDFESPAYLKVPSFVRDRRGNVYRWEVKGALKYQKYVEDLKRSKSAQLFEDGVKNPRRWQISNICEGGTYV